MKIKPSVEYHLWFLLTLIATVLSAFVIPNPWVRAGGVAVFSILCHLFGVKEGDIKGRTDILRMADEHIAKDAAAAAPQAGEGAAQ